MVIVPNCSPLNFLQHLCRVESIYLFVYAYLNDKKCYCNDRLACATYYAKYINIMYRKIYKEETCLNIKTTCAISNEALNLFYCKPPLHVVSTKGVQLAKGTVH